MQPDIIKQAMLWWEERMKWHPTINIQHQRDMILEGTHLEHVMEAMHWLERGVGQVLSKKLNPDYYDNISFSYSFFIEGLEHILQHCGRKRPKFLDVGCGIGTKCFLAHRLGYAPTGLDCNPNYLKVVEAMGEGLDGRDYQEIKTIEADGITFNHYDEYDVIYWYLPIRNAVMMNQLEDAIFEGARSGAILFPASTVHWNHRDKRDKCECVIVHPRLQYFMKK